jgi:hypothetical protein
MNWKIWLIIAPVALLALAMIWRLCLRVQAERNLQKALLSENIDAIVKPSIAQAKAAVQVVSARQKADVESFNIRTDLQISKLETVRRELEQTNGSYLALTATLPSVLDRESEMVQGNAFGKVKEKEWQLQSTSTMVNSFHQSIVFFRQKWQGQVDRLIEDFPMTELFPDECGLTELLKLPDGIIEAEAKLRVALRLDPPSSDASL